MGRAALPKTARRRLCSRAACVVYASLAVSSMRTTSAAYDETAHLPAGYTYLTLRDFRLNPEHPPLVKELAALPLLLMDVRSRTGLPAWQLGQEWEFGHRFLYQWNDADRLLFWGRLPVVALGMCRWAGASSSGRAGAFGLRAGAMAFFLCVLSPTFSRTARSSPPTSRSRCSCS
jgi:hypothetical protein